jgi:hypothetical protein
MLRRLGVGVAAGIMVLATMGVTAGPAGAGTSPGVYLGIDPNVCCLDFPELLVNVDYTCTSAQVAAGQTLAISVLLKQGKIAGKGTAIVGCAFEGFVQVPVPTGSFTAGAAFASATAGSKPSGVLGSTSQNVTIGYSS